MVDTYRMAVDNAAIFSETDARGTIIYVNDMFCTISGYRRDELVGQNHRLLNSGTHAATFFEDMWRTISSGSTWKGDICNRTKNGHIYWVHSVIVPIVNSGSGRVDKYISIRFDISEKKELLKDLEWRAAHDVLTGLPNRALLAQKAKETFIAQRSLGKSVVVGMLDLDSFKEVNDHHGHAVGDKLLIITANRINDVLRPGDIVARIGGDEFVFILSDLHDLSAIGTAVIRIMAAVNAPCKVNGVEFRVSACMGLTVYPKDDRSLDTLLRHADQAMYVAKQKGPMSYHLFDVTHDRKVKSGFKIINRVQQALRLGELSLYYQPKISLDDCRIVGFEALLRWHNPEKGLVSPLDFLPQIENDKIICEIGEWAIESALAQIAAWNALGRNWSVSVNIAARHFQEKNFTERLAAVLNNAGQVNAGLLDIEIVESVALDNIDYVSQCIVGCQALGVTFSIDDFGTGYSSLSYLKRLPTQTLKIDQSFVRDMLVDPEDFSITSAIIGLAKAFDKVVVAEGVETQEHFFALKQLGCDFAQGYLIARPMPAADILQWEAEYLKSARYNALRSNEGVCDLPAESTLLATLS